MKALLIILSAIGLVILNSCMQGEGIQMTRKDSTMMRSMMSRMMNKQV